MRIQENELNVVNSSFRDPSGFLFWKQGALYRQVNLSYQKNYDQLMNSGLYEDLVNKGLLIPHEEVSVEAPKPGIAYKIIKPQYVSFISYPYEWSFSQLKDAALTTLQIQKIAFDFGMSLKDSSAYNIQFYKGKPILIDTLSFETYKEGEPWVAYRQFCQHFLAPLALMSFRDIRLSQLLRVHIDGIPLDLASKLLSWRSRFSMSLLSHIHLHAKSQKYFADKAEKRTRRQMGNMAFRGVLDSLESSTRKLQWQPKGTEWGSYYGQTNYEKEAFEHKKKILHTFLDKAQPKVVWDLGGNTGVFSRIASDKGIETISFDIDPAAVEKNYREVREKKETHILPLALDLTNPSSQIGWSNEERDSLLARGPADMVFVLALIHHLAISNNLPFENIAQFFSRVCHWLIIEFVPKEDSNVKRLLASREDIFPNYTQESFESEFENYFEIQLVEQVRGSDRKLYLMKRTQGI